MFLYIFILLLLGNSVTSIEAGLPNIKGSQYFSAGSVSMLRSWTGATTGAFKTELESHTGDITSQGDSNANQRLLFDASLYNPIYSDSVTTVQPSSITLIPQIRY